MNTYVKFAPNVFLAKCEQPHKKGEKIIVTTRYGKENEHIVHNLIKKIDNHYYYSITRADGYNSRERARRKSERYKDWSLRSKMRSKEYFEASNEGREFLVLGEPIKVGHHSEKRHRKLLERNWNRLGKAVEMDEKAKKHASKAEYWEMKSEEINLSMPESLPYYSELLEKARAYHAGLKNGSIKRRHAYDLQYARKRVKDLEKKVELAKKLWE